MSVKSSHHRKSASILEGEKMWKKWKKRVDAGSRSDLWAVICRLGTKRVQKCSAIAVLWVPAVGSSTAGTDLLSSWPSLPTAYSTLAVTVTVLPTTPKPETVHWLSFRSQRQSDSQNTPLIQLLRHQKSNGLRNREHGVQLEPICLPSCRVRGQDRWCWVNSILPPFSFSWFWAFSPLSSFWASSSFVAWGSRCRERSCRGVWGERRCVHVRHPRLDTDKHTFLGNTM